MPNADQRHPAPRFRPRAFAAPPLLRDGPLEEDFLGQIAVSFGIKRDRVLAHQWVDNGPGWAVVQLATAAEVLALRPDLSLIPTAMTDRGRAATIEITADTDGTIWVGGAATAYIRGTITL